MCEKENEILVLQDLSVWWRYFFVNVFVCVHVCSWVRQIRSVCHIEKPSVSVCLCLYWYACMLNSISVCKYIEKNRSVCVGVCVCKFVCVCVCVCV